MYTMICSDFEIPYSLLLERAKNVLISIQDVLQILKIEQPATFEGPTMWQ